MIKNQKFKLLPLAMIICSISQTVHAKPPNVEQLWSLLQEQQKQLQDQRQQLQSQQKEISTLQSKLKLPLQTTSTADENMFKLTTVKVDEEAESGLVSTIDTNTSMVGEEIINGGDDDYLQENKSGNFSYTGYMTANYHNYNWETDPDRRAKGDLERFVLEGRYQFDDKLAIQAEIEFEHGGTGATMEFERLEEFGEFEQEIEKGGEIVLEELFLDYQIKRDLGIRIGEIPVPVGLINKRHRPSNYFTVERSESESSMIPVAWHELGIGVYGYKGPWQYQAQLISGLDSTGFSSAFWVKDGHQSRFEQKNMDNLAISGRLDYDFKYGFQIGASAYFGNTSDNRPKADLEDDAYVTIVGLDGYYEIAPWTIRSSFLWGNLSNSEAVSAANRRLPNSLGVARTPVAERSIAWNVEVGYDLFDLFESRDSLLGTNFDWFLRYDTYDTMNKVQGNIFKNVRYERDTWTTGFNYGVYKGVVFKGQFSKRKLGSAKKNKEDTLSLGFGVEF